MNIVIACLPDRLTVAQAVELNRQVRSFQDPGMPIFLSGRSRNSVPHVPIICMMIEDTDLPFLQKDLSELVTRVKNDAVRIPFRDIVWNSRTMQWVAPKRDVEFCEPWWRLNAGIIGERRGERGFARYRKANFPYAEGMNKEQIEMTRTYGYAECLNPRLTFGTLKAGTRPPNGIPSKIEWVCTFTHVLLGETGPGGTIVREIDRYALPY